MSASRIRQSIEWSRWIICIAYYKIYFEVLKLYLLVILDLIMYKLDVLDSIIVLKVVSGCYVDKEQYEVFYGKNEKEKMKNIL